MKRLLSGAGLALLLALAAAPLSAQGPVMLGLEPMDPADPRARRATELVGLLLSGDRAGVDAYLARHAGGELARPAERDRVIPRVMKELAAGPYAVEQASNGQEGRVLVRLRGNGGGGPMAVMVTLEPTAPHRVTGIRAARPTLRTAPGDEHGGDDASAAPGRGRER